MRALLLLSATLFVAGVAAAQDTNVTPAFQVETHLPPRNGAPIYPQQAMVDGQSGLAQICCSVNDDRVFECEVGAELPEGSGFGESAVRLAGRIRLSEASAAEIRSRATPRVPLAYRFQLEPVPPTLDQAAEEARLRARDLCGAGTGVAAEYVTITGTRINQRRPRRCSAAAQKLGRC